MGCWNKTCSLSNLPIFAGDKSVLYFIVNKSYDGADPMPSYPTAEWDVIPLPFYGEYDDYGRQTMDDGQEWKLDILHEALSDRVKPYHHGETGDRGKMLDSIDKSIDQNIFKLGFDEIFNRIHRGNFEFSMYGAKCASRVSFVMYHKNVYDAVIATGILKDYEPIFEEFHTFRAKRYAEDVTKFGEEFAKVKNTIGLDSAAWQFVQEKQMGYNDPLRQLILMVFSTNSSEMSFNKAIFNELTEHERKIEAHGLIVEACALELAYYQLRKSWHPAIGEGSQEGINPFYTALFTASINQLNARVDKELEWDAEDEAEEQEVEILKQNGY